MNAFTKATGDHGEGGGEGTVWLEPWEIRPLLKGQRPPQQMVTRRAEGGREGEENKENETAEGMEKKGKRQEGRLMRGRKWKEKGREN